MLDELGCVVVSQNKISVGDGIARGTVHTVSHALRGRGRVSGAKGLRGRRNDLDTCNA